MRASRIARVVLAGGLAGSLLTAGAGAATAAESRIVLPAGLACADFALGVDLGAPRSANGVWRVFHDRDGSVVRTLLAGTGYQMTFTNLTSGAAITFASGGAVIHSTVAADGTETVRATGHILLVLYPTDYPVGPSTTVYTGNATYTVDPWLTFTLQAWSGRKIDVCAALS
jgi:hypothetical protein